MSEINWIVDPVAATLLALLALGVLVFISFDFVRVKVVSGSPSQSPSPMRRRRVELDRMHCECGRRLIVERYCAVCDGLRPAGGGR